MMNVFPMGDKALVVKMGEVISPEIHARIRKLLLRIESNPIQGIVDLIPAYAELTIQYDPLKLSYKQLNRRILHYEPKLDELELPTARIVCVPVCYGGLYGPDLSDLARQHGFSEEQFMDLHSAVDYLVYMLGFTPGFCYLGGMDKRLATPRKTTPGLHIPAGSVGIAGGQTGIYPIESPGGWHIIGRTPLKLFDPDREPVFHIQMGDILRFCPVSETEYEQVSSQINLGTYRLEVIQNE